MKFFAQKRQTPSWVDLALAVELSQSRSWTASSCLLEESLDFSEEAGPSLDQDVTMGNSDKNDPPQPVPHHQPTPLSSVESENASVPTPNTNFP